MHKSVFLSMAVVLALTACTSREGEPGARPVECVPVGNDARRTYCALTYSQLLSHPRDYDGRRIFIHAWAVRKGDEILFFPSMDSYEGGEIYASLKAGRGTAHGQLLKYLKMRPELQPARVKVGGMFLLNANQGTKSASLKSEDVFRLGQLDEIDDFGI